MTKSLFVFIILLFITSCDDLKVTDEIDKKNPDYELVEGVKDRIFNQPNSSYQNTSSRGIITNLIDSVIFANSRGVYQDGYLFNDVETLPMLNRTSDTNFVKLAFSKRSEKEDSINAFNLFPNEIDWDGNEVRIIPVEMNIDDNTRKLVENDKNLPYYFKKSILNNIPVYLYLRIRNVNYKGNSFEDGGLSKKEIGKTYHYGNYESKDIVVSVSFMYFEPKNDTLSHKYTPTLLIRDPNIQPFGECKYLNSCCNNQSNWFGYFEVGRMDYRLTLGDLKVLHDDFKYFENAPANIDINYSGAAYFNEKAIEISGWVNDRTIKYNDISAKLINCITNIPLNFKNRELLNYNGGFVKNPKVDGMQKYFVSIFTTSIGEKNDTKLNTVDISSSMDKNIIDANREKFEIPQLVNKEDLILQIRSKFSVANKTANVIRAFEFNCPDIDICKIIKVKVYRTAKAVNKVSIDYRFIDDSRKYIEFYFENIEMFFKYQVSEIKNQSDGSISKNEKRIYLDNNRVVKYIEDDLEKFSIDNIDYSKESIENRIFVLGDEQNIRDLLCKELSKYFRK